MRSIRCCPESGGTRFARVLPILFRRCTTGRQRHIWTDAAAPGVSDRRSCDSGASVGIRVGVGGHIGVDIKWIRRKLRAPPRGTVLLLPIALIIRHAHGSDQINLSSVIGRSRRRFPVALKMALATTAPIPVIPISPTPCAPIGVCGSGISVQITSMSGTSR